MRAVLRFVGDLLHAVGGTFYAWSRPPDPPPPPRRPRVRHIVSDERSYFLVEHPPVTGNQGPFAVGPDGEILEWTDLDDAQRYVDQWFADPVDWKPGPRTDSDGGKNG